jgi:adenosylhomocysteine nucleosidase
MYFRSSLSPRAAAALAKAFLCLVAFSPLHAQAPLATPPTVAAPAPAPPPPPKSGPEYIAVLSSFPEELEAIEKVLVPAAAKLQVTRVNGLDFSVAEVDGRRYLFFVTGMSLVNAAMNTQLALDHFNIRDVYFTGIAGGINPAYSPGDVVVPARWAYHAEAAYFNETAPGQFNLAGYFHQKYANFGMIFPDNVTVKRDGMPDWSQVPFFPADDKLLAAAKKATDAMPPLKLGDRVSKVVCGGDGVSGTVFCDNAEYRKWIFTVWKAECVDMESTAIAQVCWENRVPCLIVRGLSDLAGGQAGANQEEEYLKAAADHSAEVLEVILKNAP